MRLITKPNQLKSALIALMMMVGLGVAMPASTYAATPATWTSHPASDDTQAWRGITWAPELGIFVSVGAGGSGAMTSPDGINWTPRSTPDALHSWRGVAWSPELHLFAAVGSATSGTINIMTSPDGINWTLRNSTLGGSPQGIVWSPEQDKFVTVIGPSGGAASSTDGITWTPATTPPQGGRNVIWSKNDNQYVSTRSSANLIYTSPDGSTWTPRTATLPNLDVAYSPTLDRYVAVGTTGIMSSNDNAITWTTQTSPVTNLKAIEWSPENGEFVAIGAGGIVTSPDGITWTPVTAPSTNGWDAITWSPQLSRYVATSTDGTNRTMVGIVPTIPNAPINLSAAQNGTKIHLSWTVPSFDGNSAITGYRIERSVNGGPFAVLVANTGSSATTYEDSTILGSTTYAYRVYALNSQGQSIGSNDASVLASALLSNTGMSQYGLIAGASVLLFAGLIITIRLRTARQ